MHDRPFTEKIRQLAPERFEKFLRAVERNRREGELRRMVEQYGRPVRFEIVEEAEEEAKKAA